MDVSCGTLVPNKRGRWITTRRLAPGVFAVLMMLTGCVSQPAPEQTVRVTTPSASSGTTTETPTGAEPRVTETSVPGQVITSVDELVRRFGWPAGTDYGRLRIPAISVDARIGAQVVARDGTMPNPVGPADVVWYDMAAWPGMGGSPGSGGNAIFSGHLDYDYLIPQVNVRYRGKGVFASLSALKLGDVIEVERGGEKIRYAVVWQRQLSASSGVNWADIWSSAVPKDSVTLYTCAGRFDSNVFEYADRLVVRAERIS